MKIAFLIATIAIASAAQANTLYGVCKGPGVDFSFVGEGDISANISITSARLSIAGQPAIVLSETDGLYANSVSSFKLGSSIYRGDLVINEDNSLELTESGFSEKATCRTNLFDGKIVSVDASETFAGIPYVNQVKAKARSIASKLCPGDPVYHPNIALIGPELLKGYQTEIVQLFGDTVVVKVHAQFRCLDDGKNK